jgi:rod shape determining protein RodA
MLLVKTPLGHEVNGARRWIKLTESFTFQPSEMVKIALILFFAYFFMKYKENLNTIKILALSFIFAGVLLFLIVEQPDLSTTIATGVIFIVLLFVAGLSYKIIVGVLAVVVPVVSVALIFIIQKAKDAEFVAQNYQIKRILAWLYPTKYADNALQQQNAIMAIGSGGLFGKGLNNSEATSMKNANFIVEPQTDFIFAVIAEELGGIFAICLLLVYVSCFIMFINISLQLTNNFYKLLAVGLSISYAFQIFLCTGGVIKLIPHTGVTLPLISYGGSSILSTIIVFAVIQGLYLLKQREDGLLEQRRQEIRRRA